MFVVSGLKIVTIYDADGCGSVSEIGGPELLTIPPSSLLISADLTGTKDFVELEIAGIFRFSLGQCSHSSTDSDSPAYAVFSDCDSANPDRAIPWRRNRSWETTRIGGTMRVVPAHAALGSPAPRASRTNRNIAHGGHGSPSVRIPASCIAGEVLQIAESTEKKLSANPKVEHLSADKAKAVLAEPSSLADTIPELLRWQGRN